MQYFSCVAEISTKVVGGYFFMFTLYYWLRKCWNDVFQVPFRFSTQKVGRNKTETAEQELNASS